MDVGGFLAEAVRTFEQALRKGVRYRLCRATGKRPERPTAELFDSRA